MAAKAKRRASTAGPRSPAAMIGGVAVGSRLAKKPRTKLSRKRIGDTVEKVGTVDGRKVFVEREKYTLASGILSQFLDQDTARVARKVREEIKRIFDTHGYGTWPPNEPGTIEWKGHASPMRGILGNPEPLRDSVQVVSLGGGSIQVTHHVRFPDTPHPYATWGDGSPMTYNDLASLHEFGYDMFDVEYPPRAILPLLDAKKKVFNQASVAALETTTKRLDVKNPAALRGDR